MDGSEHGEARHVPVRMILFVAGEETNSRRAKENLARLCSEVLNKDYELDIIDVFEDFQAAMEHHVMVTPTLIVTDPPPGLRILGDLRDEERLHAILALEPAVANS